MPITLAQLQAQFELDDATIKRWRGEGLPCKGRGKHAVCDETETAAWLIAKGYAQQATPQFRRRVQSLQEVANYFGVSLNTVRDWRDARGMPGYTAGHGRPGCYDLDEIEAWCKSRGLDKSDEVAQAIRAEELRKRKRENDEAEGKLIDRGTALQFVTQRLRAGSAMLQRLPRRIYALTPAALGEDLKANILEQCEQAVADALNEMSEAWRLAPDVDDEAADS